MAISGQNPLLYGRFENIRSDIISTGYPKHFVRPAQVLQTLRTRSDPITRPRSRVRSRKPAKMAISGQNPLLLRTENIRSDVIPTCYQRHLVKTRTGVTNTQNQV